MASPFGQTSNRVQDYQVRRDLERKGGVSVGIVPKPTVPVSVSGTPSVPQVKKKVQSAIGVVYVNQLPFDPLTRTIADPSPDYDYKFNHFGYTPNAGYYGWYVYGIISHNLMLDNKDDYLINLIGLEDWGNYTGDTNNLGEDFLFNNIFDTANPNRLDRMVDIDQDLDTDIADAITRALYFQDRQYNVHHEGLNSNQIILHGVHKPDLAMYWGGVRPTQTPHYLGDPVNRIVQTNMAFKYIIQKRIKEM